LTGSYRFMKTHRGVTAYASVTVQSQPNAIHRIEWNDGLEPIRRAWGADIERGIEQAETRHRQGGAAPHIVRVVEVIDSPVDTTSDALTCAAAIATWLSLGGDAAETQIVVDGNGWKVVLGEDSAPIE
jgi:hypothetical protein